MAKPPDFASRVLRWFDNHGRHDLPWQHPRDPYRVWLAEVMLQQTQVTTVIPYFLRFTKRFPTIAALAIATQDEVLADWSGLGYYARARNLHKAAQFICQKHDGDFPTKFDDTLALPGIGKSTAGAILAQSFDQKHAILDGNVKRVLSRHAGIYGWSGKKQVSEKLWTRAESLLPKSRFADYTQAMMDLGATLCTRSKPDCASCPISDDCYAVQNDAVLQLPESRPKRLRPARVAEIDLTIVGDKLFLQRRPPSGIWGGLWTPPVNILDELPEQMPDNAFLHRFTHFDLTLIPKVTRLKTVNSRVQSFSSATVEEQNQQQWLTIKQALKLGLPAPIRKYLIELDKDLI